MYSAETVSIISCLIKVCVDNCSQYTTCETCTGTDAERDGETHTVVVVWCTIVARCDRDHSV